MKESSTAFTTGESFFIRDARNGMIMFSVKSKDDKIADALLYQKDFNTLLDFMTQFKTQKLCFKQGVGCRSTLNGARNARRFTR